MNAAALTVTRLFPHYLWSSAPGLWVTIEHFTTNQASGILIDHGWMTTVWNQYRLYRILPKPTYNLSIRCQKNYFSMCQKHIKFDKLAIKGNKVEKLTIINNIIQEWQIDKQSWR